MLTELRLFYSLKINEWPFLKVLEFLFAVRDLPSFSNNQHSPHDTPTLVAFHFRLFFLEWVF